MVKKMPPPKEKKKDQYNLIVGNHAHHATPIEREREHKKNLKRINHNNNKIILIFF
jgi:hypothetical protein